MLSDHEIQRIADRIVEALGSRSSIGDEYLDCHRAAELLGCSVATVERRTRDGSIPSVKVGRLRRYRRADLLAMDVKGGPSDA